MVETITGRSVLLGSEWRAFPGGPLVDLDAAPSIRIVPMAGGGPVLGPTTDDVVRVSLGLYSYVWIAAVLPGSYAIIWEGTSGGTPVSATEGLTVTAAPAQSNEPCDWDVDPAALGVCPGWSGYSTAVKQAALQLSTLFLWAATGRQYGVCPITLRPSQDNLGEPAAYQAFPVWPGQDPAVQGPFLFGGRWFNAGCGGACCNSAGCAVVLRGPVASVDEVLIGDDVVSAGSYRVDVSRGTYLLVRTDGLCWPQCQNFTADEGETGAFSVTYGIGRPLTGALRLAAAVLACEYGKSLTGAPCGLPARMTRMTRQGVEIEVDSPDPDDGKTGIKIVDDVIAMLNPNGLKQTPVVLSPDLPESCDRMTVWTSGS